MVKYPFNNKSEYSMIYISIGIFLFWFSILLFSGSLSSGYHFTDDHQILEINQKLSSFHNSTMEVYKQMIIHDFTSRFRPLFYFHKILETKVFGINFHLWSIYTGILAALTSLFLYLSARIIGFSHPESFAFSVLCLLGKQSEIWWRLGTNETIGTFFMSLSLLFMAMSIYSKHRKTLYEMLFLIFTILMSLSKESFILLIPAILFWKIWLYQERNNTKWIDALKYNRQSLLPLFLIAMIELSIIKFYIGTTKVGYAGIHGFNLMDYYKSGISLFKVGETGLILTQAILLVIFVSTRSTLKVFLTNFIYPLILFLLIVVPQIILYARSGFWARYIMPGLLGYFVFIIYLLKSIRTNASNFPLPLSSRQMKPFNSILLISGIVIAFTGMLIFTNQKVDNFLLSYVSLLKARPIAPHWIDRLHAMSVIPMLLGSTLAVIPILLILKKWRFYSLFIIWTLLAFYFFTNCGIAVSNARAYAAEGEATSAFLNSIIENTQEDDLILIVVDPALTYEWGGSIKVYLNIIGRRSNLYVYKLLTKPNYNNFKKSLISRFDRFYGSNEFENIGNRDKVKCMAILPKAEDAFLENAIGWFNSSQFTRENYNGFMLYYKTKY